MYIDVATFGAQADACAKYLTKGRAVACRNADTVGQAAA